MTDEQKRLVARVEAGGIHASGAQATACQLLALIREQEQHLEIRRQEHLETCKTVDDRDAEITRLQAQVTRLREALRQVIVIADRETVEFQRAKRVLAETEPTP